MEPNGDCMADRGFNIKDPDIKRRATFLVFPRVSNFPQRHAHKHDTLQLYGHILRGLFKDQMVSRSFKVF